MEKSLNRKSGYDTGTASEFLVLSNLYRLGVNAFISLGNKKSIDLIIKAKNGSSISVDVKSVQGYSSIVVNNVKVILINIIPEKMQECPMVQNLRRKIYEASITSICF